MDIVIDGAPPRAPKLYPVIDAAAVDRGVRYFVAAAKEDEPAATAVREYHRDGTTTVTSLPKERSR